MEVNQFKEQNHQVTLYRKASRVIAWLGGTSGGEAWQIPFRSISQDEDDEENATGELLFGAITEIVNRWLSYTSFGQKASYLVVVDPKDTVNKQVSSSKKNFGVIKGLEDPDLDASEEKALPPSLWQAFKELFENRWFWRL